MKGSCGVCLLVYVNDMTEGVSSYMFADTKLLRKIRNHKDWEKLEQ